MIPVPAHMAHLPVRNHLPIPHVTLWSSELPEAEWTWRHDPVVDRPAWFTPGAPLAGDAIRARQHPARQRASMMLLRCSYCDAGIDHGQGWLLVPLDQEPEAVTVDGRTGTSVVVREPWLCRPCARYAAEFITDSGSFAAEMIGFHRPQHWMPIMETGYPPDHPMAAAAATAQPTSIVKLAVGDGLTVDLDGFLALPTLHTA